MLFVFLPESSNAVPDVSVFRCKRAEGEGVCGSAELDIKVVEIESVDIDLGRKKRGRLSVRGRSSGNLRGSREENSGTEPRRGTVTSVDGSRGKKLSGRGWELCGKGLSNDEKAVEKWHDIGDVGDSGE